MEQFGHGWQAVTLNFNLPVKTFGLKMANRLQQIEVHNFKKKQFYEWTGVDKSLIVVHIISAMYCSYPYCKV